GSAGAPGWRHGRGTAGAAFRGGGLPCCIAQSRAALARVGEALSGGVPSPAEAAKAGLASGRDTAMLHRSTTAIDPPTVAGRPALVACGPSRGGLEVGCS